MGVLQRFERRLEGLVEGTFARVFGGVVQPVEVAAALQREGEDKKAIVGAGRILIPNTYVVELGASDAERLSAYDAPLRRELTDMVSENAQERGWSFVGPVDVRFEEVPDLDTGMFRVRSSVLADDQPLPAGRSLGASLVVTAEGKERVVPLVDIVTVIGRGAEADLRLADTGVSRRHAELRVEGGLATVVDLGSTNGTTVNGRKVSRQLLVDGDRVGIGATTLIFRRDA
ncbi:MAG: FHA domain-containing protein [Actinomycetota bacterium]|nr:FHA domain-containing protein [Actinomycetota bacterium]